jgi:transcriptional regulator with XRE-family HTH domain
VMQDVGQITKVKNLRTIAERMKELREARGWSQEQLAEKAGVTQGTIGNIESGLRKQPRQLLALAKALDVEPDWLQSGQGPMRLHPAAADQLRFSISEPAPSPYADSVTISDTDWDMLVAFQELPEDERLQLARETMDKASKYKAFANEVLRRHTVTELSPKMPDKIKPAPQDTPPTRPRKAQKQSEEKKDT